MPGTVLSTWHISQDKTKLSALLEHRSFCYSIARWSDEVEGWIRISHRKETWHIHQNSMDKGSEGGLDAL